MRVLASGHTPCALLQTSPLRLKPPPCGSYLKSARKRVRDENESEFVPVTQQSNQRHKALYRFKVAWEDQHFVTL